jgi:hypothetical protein
MTRFGTHVRSSAPRCVRSCGATRLRGASRRLPRRPKWIEGPRGRTAGGLALSRAPFIHTASSLSRRLSFHEGTRRLAPLALHDHAWTHAKRIRRPRLHLDPPLIDGHLIDGLPINDFDDRTLTGSPWKTAARLIARSLPPSSIALPDPSPIDSSPPATADGHAYQTHSLAFQIQKRLGLRPRRARIET